jgi:protein-tyrosine phosphatase
MTPVWTALGAVVRAVRRGRDRVLHPWRRRQALAWLRRHRMPRGVLFVCHGNICRSPYAEGVFRARVGAVADSVIRIRSAGFIGPDRPSPRFAIEEAAARGVDLRSHRSMLLSAGEVRQAEIVVVMEAAQAEALRERYPTAGTILVLGDLDPRSDGGRTIIDPVDQPRVMFAASYDRIDRCVAVLAEAVAG